MFDKHFSGKNMGVTSLGERGQIVIPANIREQLKLKAGDKLLVFAKRNNFIGLVRADALQGFLKKILGKIEGLSR